MKNNYLKTLAFILIGVVSFTITTDVSAEIVGKFSRGGEVAKIPNSGLIGTHEMSLTIDGNKQEAYCVWWEKDPPLSDDEMTFAEATFDYYENSVGVAYILNKKDKELNADIKECNEKLGSGKLPTYRRVIKTTALNLYLSMKGETMGSGEDSNRFDGKESQDGHAVNKYNDDLPEMLKVFKEGTTLEGDDDYAVCYRKIVASLIEEAASAQLNIENNGSNPSEKKLGFEVNDDDFELKGGYYQKTYKLKSSDKILKSIGAKVTGIDTTGVVIDKDKINKKVTVKIPRKVMESIADKSVIKVTAYAEYSINTVRIYYQEKQRANQDLIFATSSEDTYKVSTDDKPTYKTCYRYVTTCESTTCDNDNKNNERTCSGKIEPYQSMNCSVYDNDVKKSGKKTANLIDGVCSLYCTETATVSYPGNVTPAVSIYTHFSWPTKDGYYTLNTISKLVCTIEMNNGGAVTQACIDKAKKVQYKNGSDSATLIYDDTKDEQQIKLKQRCTTSNPEITGDIVKMNNLCTYTLPANKYIAVSKKTIKFVDNVASKVEDDTINEILINKHYGVLPVGGISGYIDLNKTEAKKLFASTYKLEITNMPLGYAGQFTTKVNSNAYVCNYKVTDVRKVDEPCECPPGTENAGVDLSYIFDSSVKCADAREKYCDSEKIDTCTRPSDGKEMNITDCKKNNTEEYCINKYCPPVTDLDYCEIDGEQFEITGCMLEGKTRDECTEEKCPPGGGDGKSCPPESTYPGRTYEGCNATEEECIKMICYDTICDGGNCLCPEKSDYPDKDITDCIYSEIRNGKNFNSAKDYCVKKYCFEGSGSGIIIYRTISLENPFPSMDADTSTTQTGLTVGMFNDTVKGRYPGSNWNSVMLVKNKILNNRGYDGSAIYQEAKPLYVIELDSTAIKKIRDYNASQVQDGGYADFTLTCTNGAYCRSSFLRDGRYKMANGKQILTGGTCHYVDGKDSFVNCYETKKG